MRGEIFADILLILLISSVIAVILCMVNRGKKAKTKTSVETETISTEENKE